MGMSLLQGDECATWGRACNRDVRAGGVCVCSGESGDVSLAGGRVCNMGDVIAAGGLQQGACVLMCVCCAACVW